MSLSSVDDGSEFSDKYIRPNKLTKILPNYNQIENHADASLEEIKRIFIYCIEGELYYEKFNYGVKLLNTYLSKNGLRLTEQDFVWIVKLLYNVILIKEIDAIITSNVIFTLQTLLKMGQWRISRSSLELNWKDLYDIWVYHCHSSMAKNGMICTKSSIVVVLPELIRKCSNYFPVDSTEEIWNSFCSFIYQPYPYNVEKYNGLTILRKFLPSYYNNHGPFLKFVWPNIVKLFDCQTFNNSFENDFMQLLHDCATPYVGLIDWTPYLDRLFTGLLRSLKVKITGVHKKSKYSSTRLYVEILIYAIYGSDDSIVIEKFKQLFQAISHLYHPSSAESQSSVKMLTLLFYMSFAILNRYQNERKHKRPHPTKGFYSEEFFLSNNHIKQLVEIMMPSMMSAIFTKNRSGFSFVLQSMQSLANLCPQIVIPQCLQLLHDTTTSSESILQPHRTLSILAVISMVHVPMLNSPEEYPDGKLAVFPLMRMLIGCININDLPKSYISMMCFGNLANILYIEDMSDKAGEEGLTPFEREVALATAQFEDLILQLFDRIFEMIEISFSDSGMVEPHKSSDFRTQTLVDMMLMVIPNMGDTLTKQVLDKTLDFVFTHSLQNRHIQSFITSIFTCLLEKSEQIIQYAHSKFFPKYFRYFKECLQDDCIVLGEHIDVKFSWLTYVMPGLMRASQLSLIQDDLFLLLETLDKIRSSQAIKLFNVVIYNMFNLCCKPYATLEPMRCLKQTDFYRDSWRGLIKKSDLVQLHDLGQFKLEYTFPGQVQKSIVDQLITRYIRPSIEVIDKFTQLTRTPNNTTKLEPLELKFAYYKITHITTYMSEEKIAQTDNSFFEFDRETCGPVEPFNIKDFLQFNFAVKHQPNSMWLELCNDLRRATSDATKAVTEFMRQPNYDISNLPIIITEFLSLFNLLYKSYELSSGINNAAESKSFLDRRFYTFFDFRTEKCNTPFNWILMFDWMYFDSCCPHKYVLTNEIIEIVELLLELVCCSNRTIQESSIVVIFNLCQNYLQLHIFVINKCWQIIQQKLNSPDGIDENSHNGIGQLLLKVFKNYAFANESMYFVYKLVAIFTILCKNQLTEHRSNNNYTNKLFKSLIRLSCTFQAKKLTIMHPQEVSQIAEGLHQSTTVHTDQLQCLLPQVTNPSQIIEERCMLYYWCVDYCLSVFLQTSNQGVDTEHLSLEMGELFTDSLISSTLRSTTTWTSTLQMSIVLPLHHELEISVKALQMYLLTLFSPSKELSSQACNQISIMVWLIRGKAPKHYVTREEMSKSINQSHVTLQTLSLNSSGPRDDNHWLIIDKDTDYWSLPSYAKPASMLHGFLGWSERIKMRDVSNTINVERYHKKSDSKNNWSGDNAACWELLCKVFKSDVFHEQLRKFLIHLASHFLRMDDLRTNGVSSSQHAHKLSNEYASFGLSKSEGNEIQHIYSVSSFSLENLVNSILTCIGPEEGLDNVIETYNALIKYDGQHQMYVHKLASKVIFGILIGIKYWKSEMQKNFFNNQLATLMETHLQYACKSELNAFPQAIYDISSSTSSIDVRQLTPLYRYTFNRLIDMQEHESTKQVACLHFINCFVKLCSWCIGPNIALDMMQLWHAFVTSSIDKVRREAGKLMRNFFIFHTLSNEYYFRKFCNESHETDFNRLSQFFSDVKQLLALHTGSILTEKELKVSEVTQTAAAAGSSMDIEVGTVSEIEKVIEKFENQNISKIGDVGLVNDDKDEQDLEDEDVDDFDSSSRSSSVSILEIDNKLASHPESPVAELESTATQALLVYPSGRSRKTSESEIKDRVVATMCSFLSELSQKFGECLDEYYLDLFHIAIDLIPVRNKVPLYQNLRHWAFTVSNLMISTNVETLALENLPIQVRGRRAIHPRSILHLVNSCAHHQSWRVRLVASKMMQFISFYNLFVISHAPYLQLWVKLVFELLEDRQIEVRKEAVNLLSGLIQCGIYRVDAKFIGDMTRKITALKTSSVSATACTNSELVEAHTGVLSLAAFIQAHPFDIPAYLPDALNVLCSAINKPEPLATTVRMTLATFKKSHQETWHLERHHFTEDQLCALTDVLVSPSYYA